MSGWCVTAGDPARPGVSLDREGANVSVFSDHAELIELCLFDGERETARIPLPERTGGWHHAHVAGIASGQHYGLRAHGAWAPEAGHRFNPAKLLLDPYATAWTSGLAWHPTLLGHDGDRPDPTDSAPYMPRCVAAPRTPAYDGRRPRVPWSETVIYEAHLKSLTQLWPGLPARLAGTVEALGQADVIAHLTGLGVTSVELLPIHGMIDERRLTEQGLSNHWGYNSVGFFVADPRRLGPRGFRGLVETVRALHAAGLEVILDVVYNHTGEGDADGPTLAFRGLDNASYYARDEHAPDGYANETGCGNRLDLAHPAVLRLVMDSLRWWVVHAGIDGFRFDLAPSLERGAGGFEPGSAFLHALLQDPVLAEAKLIVEPWDIGPDGYRLGAYPAPVAEWNDGARDAIRGFWRGDGDGPAMLGDTLLGSASRVDRAGRRAWSSVNFVACHDGFTLADLTLYDAKRNAANLEDNRDGHDHNRADAMGPEGPTDDPAQADARARRRRAMIATALLAQGTPMILAGDEIGQSQGGNNNAYCQDNAISWIDWSAPDKALTDCVRACLALRAAEPLLRQPDFLHGTPRADELPDAQWFGADGGPPDWDAPQAGVLGLVIRGAAGSMLGEVPRTVALVLNRGPENAAVALPAIPEGPWRRVLATADAPDGAVAWQSLAVFAAGEGP